jgi:hypothetical protein
MPELAAKLTAAAQNDIKPSEARRAILDIANSSLHMRCRNKPANLLRFTAADSTYVSKGTPRPL